MDFAPSERAKMVCEEVDEIVAEQIKPLEETHRQALSNPTLKLDEDGRLSDDIVDAYRQVARSAGENDLLGLYLPREVGGRGMEFAEAFFVRERIFEHGVGLTRYLAPIAARGPTRLLLELDEQRREEFLDPLLAGEKTACLGLTEPSGGSDIGAMQTTARKEGDEFVINGHKKFVGNGPYADFAQVFAQTSPENGIRGITGFVVDMNDPGVHRGPVNRDAMDKGEWCELLFDDCRVPVDNVIGKVDEGIGLVMDILNKERVMMAAQCSGLANYVIDQSVDHARTRETWGEPIGNRQAIQWLLADAETKRTALRCLGLYGAWMLDKGDDLRKVTSIVKLFSTKSLSEIADAAVQVHGGDGMMKDRPFWKVYNQARSMQIYEGTNEIMRRNIARELGVFSG